MTKDRLRIPQDPEYFQAIGLATIAFARLEWNAVWCCERLKPDYIGSIEKRKKTAGTIGRDLASIFARIIDDEFRLKISPYAVEFREIVELRNSIVHGKPATAPNGDQRLFRHGHEWNLSIQNTQRFCAG